MKNSILISTVLTLAVISAISLTAISSDYSGKINFRIGTEGIYLLLDGTSK